MKILFLGDVVGLSGCRKITNDLLDQIQKNNIDFVIINAENADDTGVGLTKKFVKISLKMELMLLQLETMFGIKKT